MIVRLKHIYQSLYTKYRKTQGLEKSNGIGQTEQNESDINDQSKRVK
jgi:hypothetical protein